LTSTPSEAVAVAGLCKSFRPPASLRDLLRGKLHTAQVNALDGIDLSVAPGEVVCVVGANGAGKTTLLRILAGLLTPSRGTARVLGHDVRRPPASFRRQVGYVVGDERSFHWPLSGFENLCFFGALHGFTREEARRRADLWLGRVGLESAAHRRFAEYSKGMRQRLALARGLLGDAGILLLDEPTLGLDPRGAWELRRFLREDIFKSGGRTAIVGSNDPTEVRALADRVVVLGAGRITAEVAPDEVERALGVTA
jgi:ABC-2 type transport system ATP-binding protein